MTTAQSQSRIASSLCAICSTVLCRRFVLRMCCMRRAVSGSTLAVASSRHTTLGCSSITRARHNICCCPAHTHPLKLITPTLITNSNNACQEKTERCNHKPCAYCQKCRFPIPQLVIGEFQAGENTQQMTSVSNICMWA